MIRGYKDTEGKCFASVASNAGCLILSCSIAGCGTFECPFYKPKDCTAWIRIDGEKEVALLPPEEYFTYR